MGIDRKKLLGIAIVLIAFLISAINSISITSFSILDTDPGTYIIVVMLMIFLFCCFYLKEDIKLEYKRKNVIYSILIFAVYAIALSYLRVSLSSAFISYRIDALLFPLLLLSFITLVFGTSGARKFYLLIIYAAFASPLILTPILNLNGAFAKLNSSLVYNFAKFIGAPIYKIGLVIASNLGSSITISTTCVSIGTFVAFLLFLVPLAYLYDGRSGSKFYWLFSGVVLVLVLNFFRMLLIALIWVFYGISGAINIFHIFAGQFIFYISIIIMVLLAGRYGLSIKRYNSRRSARVAARRSNPKYRGIFLIAIVALLFVLIAFFLNSGYSGALNAPETLFGKQNLNSTAFVTERILSNIKTANSTVLILGANSRSYLFSIKNSSQGISNSVLIAANASSSPLPKISLPGYVPLGTASTHLLKNGIAVTSQIAESANNTFDINYFSLPYNINGEWLMVNYIVFRRINNSSAAGSCNISSDYSANPQEYVESLIYDAIRLRGAGYYGLMCQSYRIASSG